MKRTISLVVLFTVVLVIGLFVIVFLHAGQSAKQEKRSQDVQNCVFDCGDTRKACNQECYANNASSVDADSCMGRCFDVHQVCVDSCGRMSTMNYIGRIIGGT